LEQIARLLEYHSNSCAANKQQLFKGLDQSVSRLQMRFKEVWSDWKGRTQQREVIAAGASRDVVGGAAKSGGVAVCTNRYLTW